MYESVHERWIAMGITNFEIICKGILQSRREAAPREISKRKLNIGNRIAGAIWRAMLNGSIEEPAREGQTPMSRKDDCR